MNNGMKTFSAAILLAALLTACTSPGAPGGIPANAQTEQFVHVEVVSPQKGTVQKEAGLTGQLEANQIVDVAPKVNGKITSLSVKLGQKVNKGDVLFVLDQEDLQNSVRSAEAQYESSQANLTQAKDNKADNTIQAESNLKQAEQTLADAKRNLERLKGLYDKGIVTKQEVEDAQTKLANAEVSNDTARNNLESSKKNTSIVVAESSVKQAKVTLDNARSELKNSTVVAPFTGQISAINAEMGEMVSAQTAVVTMVNTNPMKVKVQSAEAEVNQLKVGDKVSVQVSALNKTVAGTIYAISPVMDETTKAFPVEIVIPNGQNELKAGMVATVDVEKVIEAQHLVIPKSAVIEDEGIYYVFKAEGNIAKKVEVSVGNMSSDQAEIITGITKDDQIVIKGQTLIKDGSKIEVSANGGKEESSATGRKEDVTQNKKAEKGSDQD